MRPIFDTGRLPLLRGQGDPAADGVVAGALAGASSEEADEILTKLTRGLRSLDDSPEAANWIECVEATPAWVQSTLVAQGQELFTEWSLDVVTSLFCASLPFAYAAAQGVEVLERVSQLAEPRTIARRIAETGQMLLDVSEPGALEPGGRGYQTVRTVRLLHAVIRARLTLTPPSLHADPMSRSWDSRALGVPINQEDLLGTLLSFTTVVFRAFTQMGIPLEVRAQESYLQLWAAVGALLGIESSASILRPLEAEALTDVIARELHSRSAAGVHLMEVLMGEMELSMPWGLRKLPRSLVRHLGGDTLADTLGVEPNAWWGGILPALATMNRLTVRFPSGRAILQAPSRLLGRSMIRMWIDRSILGEVATHLRIDALGLARLGIRTGPDRSGVGLRGRRRGYRRAVRIRQRQRRAETRTPTSTASDLT